MAPRNDHLKNLSKLLTPPGNGVFTVHTAREKKENLFKAYFDSTELNVVQKKWEKNLHNLNTDKPHLFGIPSDNGGGIQRGANWAPLIIRELLLNNTNFYDIGDVRVIPHLLHDKYLNPKTLKECQRALYGKANSLPVAPLSIAELALETIYKNHSEIKILGLGGDHSVSYPLVKTWLNSRKNKKQAAIVHFDAHTDLLDKRLGIDLCFGTWTFQILNHLASTDHLIQLGIRSSGKNKAHWKKTLGVHQFWTDEIHDLGIEVVAKKIIQHFKKRGIKELYITFDIDALDAKYAAATGTPEPDGLTPPECSTLIRILSKEFKITGADLVELAPFVWPENISAIHQKSSIEVAGDMAKILLEALNI